MRLANVKLSDYDACHSDWQTPICGPQLGSKSQQRPLEIHRRACPTRLIFMPNYRCNLSTCMSYGRCPTTGLFGLRAGRLGQIYGSCHCELLADAEHRSCSCISVQFPSERSRHLRILKAAAGNPDSCSRRGPPSMSATRAGVEAGANGEGIISYRPYDGVCASATGNYYSNMGLGLTPAAAYM